MQRRVCFCSTALHFSGELLVLCCHHTVTEEVSAPSDPTRIRVRVRVDWHRSISIRSVRAKPRIARSRVETRKFNCAVVSVSGKNNYSLFIRQGPRCRRAFPNLFEFPGTSGPCLGVRARVKNAYWTRGLRAGVNLKNSTNWSDNLVRGAAIRNFR